MNYSKKKDELNSSNINTYMKHFQIPKLGCRLCKEHVPQTFLFNLFKSVLPSCEMLISFESLLNVFGSLFCFLCTKMILKQVGCLMSVEKIVRVRESFFIFLLYQCESFMCGLVNQENISN